MWSDVSEVKWWSFVKLKQTWNNDDNIKADSIELICKVKKCEVMWVKW